VEGDPTRALDGVYYLVTDHLGSTAVTLKSDGTKYGELRNYSQGGIHYIWGTTPTEFQFTGQREMAGLGTSHYIEGASSGRARKQGRKYLSAKS
jgi:hypothetical protein